jgi:hypothetical protein
MNPKLDFTLNDDITQKVIDFALRDGISEFTKNGSEGVRRFCNLNKTNTELSEIVNDISNYIYTSLGVTDFDDEPLFGNFIGVNNETGFVHEHQDFRGHNGEWHVRINILIQKPIIGGMPVIQFKEYVIDEGDSWINFASEWTHKSTPVVGDKERIVLSLGKLIPEEQAKKLYLRFN